MDQIGGFAPEIDQASLLPDKTRYCLLISDNKGVAIEAYSPAGYEEEFHRFGIDVGGVWDERLAGTNGIDMALRTGQLVTVSGRDHFYRCFHNFACTSAPLLGAQNNSIGTVTLVGSVNRKQGEIIWCEQLLRLVASRIQMRLFSSFHAEKITARLISQNRTGRKRFETMVACDEQGSIVATLPLWNAMTPPPEHQDLQGQHLSELHNLTVNVRGPIQSPPQRRRMPLNTSARLMPQPLHPGKALVALAAQGGGMDLAVERARKLLAHRIPLLFCSEPGAGKAEFARLLLEDLGLSSPMTKIRDCASAAGKNPLGDVLKQVRFLCDYPIDGCPASLILHNVDQLAAPDRQELESFLQYFEHAGATFDHFSIRPALIFTANKDWHALRKGGAIGEKLLYLMGQAVLDLPPLRKRHLKTVLNNILQSEFSGNVEISPRAEAILLAHDWPGNHRELRAVIREALICGNGHRINATDLPTRLFAEKSRSSQCSPKILLQDALDSTGWNVTRAAGLLGKSRATVNRWIAKQGLKRPK